MPPRLVLALLLVVALLGHLAGRAAATRDRAARVIHGPSACRSPAPAPPAACASPVAAPVASTAVARPPSTTLLVLRVGARVEVVKAAPKPGLTWSPGPDGELAWSVEDAATGAELARGSTSVPPRCPCPARDDDACATGRVGCVDVARHEVVVRARVPHLVPRERVRLRDARGVELACALVEEAR